MLKLAVVAHETDNVATIVKDLKKGENVLMEIHGKGEVRVELQQDIPFGHKFAIEDIKEGQAILKYGEIIGHATEDIVAGAYVHVHNVVSERGRGDLEQSGDMSRDKF
ncbi:MAG: UxaA family hydrolase [Tissierellaceae bacterium]|nr:UxaA family hydrolase [Tissierellaceae bacterium]